MFGSYWQVAAQYVEGLTWSSARLEAFLLLSASGCQQVEGTVECSAVAWERAKSGVEIQYLQRSYVRSRRPG